MGLSVSSIGIGARAWPTAGLARLIGSRPRVATRASRAEDLETRPNGLYRTVELCAAPASLALIFDRLEAQAATESTAHAPAPGQ